MCLSAHKLMGYFDVYRGIRLKELDSSMSELYYVKVSPHVMTKTHSRAHTSGHFSRKQIEPFTHRMHLHTQKVGVTEWYRKLLRDTPDRRKLAENTKVSFSVIQDTKIVHSALLS